MLAFAWEVGRRKPLTRCVPFAKEVVKVLALMKHVARPREPLVANLIRELVVRLFLQPLFFLVWAQRNRCFAPVIYASCLPVNDQAPHCDMMFSEIHVSSSVCQGAGIFRELLLTVLFTLGWGESDSSVQEGKTGWTFPANQACISDFPQPHPACKWKVRDSLHGVTQALL